MTGELVDCPRCETCPRCEGLGRVVANTVDPSGMSLWKGCPRCCGGRRVWRDPAPLVARRRSAEDCDACRGAGLVPRDRAAGILLEEVRA